MLTPQQEHALTNSGDCFDHWHSSDRQARYEDLAAYQQLALLTMAPGDLAIGDKVDFVLADTSTQNVTITLPKAKAGRELSITKVSPSNQLKIQTSGGDKIHGSDGILVYNYGTSLKLKAVPLGWIII